MTTFTAWKFETADGAQKAVLALKGAQGDGLVKIVDHAVISWPDGADEARHAPLARRQVARHGLGRVLGTLFGGLFFVPLLGAAVGAAAGAINKAVAAVGHRRRASWPRSASRSRRGRRCCAR